MNETAMRTGKLLEHFAVVCHRNALGIWDCPDCAAIRALIESSGDKACGAVEEAMVPAIELLVNHYLQESLAYGNSIHAKSYKAAIAVIKEALLAGAIAIMDRQNEAALSQSSPVSGEKVNIPCPTIKQDLMVGPSVEEAMAIISEALEQMPSDDGNDKDELYCRADDALAVIKAALRPKVLTREELAEWIEYSGSGLMSWRVDFISHKLREKGIEVEEKP